MVRSLYSGISGLRTHQVGLDVTANNIANVNTVAFKAGRATFKESMVQMLAGPSRPAGNQGGRNPMQVGLGVAVGSIDTMLRQGHLQTTGQITDLALEGRAYFAFSNGSSTYYSRNGGLQLDSDGHLVSPTNGWRLQGKMAKADGTYGPETLVSDIRIPWGDKAPAKATENVRFACNLNSDSQALGTVTHTNRFLANADRLNSYRLTQPTPLPANPTPAQIATYTQEFDAYIAGANRSKLTDLFDENGNNLGIVEGDTLKFWVADPNLPSFQFKVERYEYLNQATGETVMIIPTLQDFIDNLEQYLNDVAAASGATITPTSRVSVSIDASGGLTVTNTTNQQINGLQVSSSRPISKAYVSMTMVFPATIEALTPGTPPTPGTATTPPLRIAAAAEDSLFELFDMQGRVLGFTDGDTIVINGEVGGRKKGVELTFYNGLGMESAAAGRTGQPTTMEELMAALSEAFGLPPTDGTMYERPSVYVKDSSDLVSDGIPIGAIVLRGQPEVAFALTGISVIAKQLDPNQPDTPTRFNTNMGFTSIQDARNTGVWPAPGVAYDDSGAQHNFVMTFTHSGIPGEWLWEITMVGGEEVILGGNRGRVTFALDGSPSSFTFDDDSNKFRFDPRNGANEVEITLNTGGPGSWLGITQFNSANTTAVAEQDGYKMGKLQEISISESGEITGMYDNGQSKSLAIIYVAEFNNPAGLLKMGDSMFGVSNNSGSATMYQPGVGSTTKVKPGAIEMSNVELETEFTNMITIQRGYQASSRVVSTSDQMLQELVQLVR